MGSWATVILVKLVLSKLQWRSFRWDPSWRCLLLSYIKGVTILSFNEYISIKKIISLIFFYIYLKDLIFKKINGSKKKIFKWGEIEW
jgi:hypothetical protein